MAAFAATTKVPSLITSIASQQILLEHHAMADDRPQNVIHPSEMAKSDWCIRATYMRIADARNGVVRPGDANRFQLENIFAEGDRIHEKWQSWLGRAGVLWGKWQCLVCGGEFLAQSPKECNNELCGSTALKYLEVPLAAPGHLIYGHADGEVIDGPKRSLLEIKSIGDGTIRVELPQTYYTYTRKGEDHTCFDLAGCFRDIRRPFPSHLRQGWLYLWLRAQSYPDREPVDTISFLYEGKATQVTKEFLIRRNDDMIEPLLDNALDIVYGLEKGKAPSCREGRRSKCADCQAYETGSREPTTNAQPGDGARGADGARQRGADQAGTGVAAQAARPRAGTRAGSADRVARRGNHRADGQVQPVGGLLGAAARSVRGGRERGEDAAGSGSGHRTRVRIPNRSGGRSGDAGQGQG